MSFEISYIVSAYERPASLMACLATLAVQVNPKQILVACNAEPGSDQWTKHALVTGHFDARIIATAKLGATECYSAADILVQRGYPAGDWLCFPSDDSLYVEDFGKIMLDTAARAKADLVYCDCVYRMGSQHNPRWLPYSVLVTEPRMDWIDKTNFIVKRERFKGFPVHPWGKCDGALIEQLLRQGVSHAKAPGNLVVHQ